MISRLGMAAAAALWMLTPARGASELFQSLSLEAEAGYVRPSGNLSSIFDPFPEAGLRVTSSYYGPYLAHALFHMGHLDGPESPAPVWYASAGVGLELQMPTRWLPAAGLGISLNYGRVSESDVPDGRYLFIQDGETEFGIYPFLRWRIPLARAWFLTADFREDVVLSEPKYSRMFSSHIGAGWRWK